MSPEHRYRLRTVVFMSSYVVFNAAAITGAFDSRQPPGTWFLGLAIAAPVVGQIWATLALMRESDEFVRGVTAKQFIVAAGLTLAIATFWGFGETFARAPHVQTWLIVPVFWAMYGLVSPFIKTSR